MEDGDLEMAGGPFAGRAWEEPFGREADLVLVSTGWLGGAEGSAATGLEGCEGLRWCEMEFLRFLCSLECERRASSCSGGDLLWCTPDFSALLPSDWSMGLASTRGFSLERNEVVVLEVVD